MKKQSPKRHLLNIWRWCRSISCHYRRRKIEHTRCYKFVKPKIPSSCETSYTWCLYLYIKRPPTFPISIRCARVPQVRYLVRQRQLPDRQKEVQWDNCFHLNSIQWLRISENLFFTRIKNQLPVNWDTYLASRFFGILIIP